MHGKNPPCDVGADPALRVAVVIDECGGECAGIDLGYLSDKGQAGPVVAHLQFSDVVDDWLGVDGVTATRGTMGQGSTVAEREQPFCCGCLDPPGPTGVHVMERSCQCCGRHVGRASQCGLRQVRVGSQQLPHVTHSGCGIGGASAVTTVTMRQIVRHDGQQAVCYRTADSPCCVRPALGVRQERFESGSGDPGVPGDDRYRQTRALSYQILDVIRHQTGIDPVGAHVNVV
jgi:hypothetical protein